MSTTQTSPMFVLPRLSPLLAADSFGFYREAGGRLGFYEPGKRPQIYDPTWTGTQSPAAIQFHEDVHQQLTINTHHGILTQILTRLSRDGLGRESLRSCLEEQWSVQEIAATYAELCLIQRTQPKHFESAVIALPTTILDQPPYRELFRAAQQLLPIDTTTSIEESIARTDVIIAIAGCSLWTGCLLELANTGFRDREFAGYLRRESPHLRFEQIVRSLGTEAIRALANETASRIRSAKKSGHSGPETISFCTNEIRRMVPHLPIETPESLGPQSDSVIATLRTIDPESQTALWKEPQGLSPEFIDAPEKRRRLQEQFPSPRIENPELLEWLKNCDAAGDLHLIIGMQQPGVVAFSSVCIPRSASVTSPDDLRGTLDPAELLDFLRPYPRFPQVLAFLGDVWRDWYGLLRSQSQDSWVHQRMMDAVRICVHRTLSRDLVQQLLEFEDLRRDTHAFVFQVGRSLYVGCFASPRNPGVYALQKIPSDAALRLFNQLLDELGVHHLDDPACVVPHLELLKRIVAREFVDPAGVR